MFRLVPRVKLGWKALFPWGWPAVGAAGSFLALMGLLLLFAQTIPYAVSRLVLAEKPLVSAVVAAAGVVVVAVVVMLTGVTSLSSSLILRSRRY